MLLRARMLYAGEVYSVGYGALGVDDGLEQDESMMPVKVVFPADSDGGSGEGGEVFIEHVDCSVDHAMAIDRAGRLFAWGRGTWGRLGLGNDRNVTTPTQVPLPGRAVHVACGGNHTVALVQEATP